MSSKLTFSALLVIISLSLISCQPDKDDKLTSLFQDFVDTELRNTNSAYDFSSYGFGIGGQRITLNELRVTQGYKKDSISAVTAQFTTKNLPFMRKIKLTFELKNGKILTKKATVDDHKGQYETSFESAQFEIQFHWYPRSGGIHLDRSSGKTLWSNGVVHAWTGFDVDIENMIKFDESFISNSVFSRVAEEWWRVNFNLNAAFMEEGLKEIFPQ